MRRKERKKVHSVGRSGCCRSRLLQLVATRRPTRKSGHHTKTNGMFYLPPSFVSCRTKHSNAHLFSSAVEDGRTDIWRFFLLSRLGKINYRYSKRASKQQVSLSPEVDVCPKSLRGPPRCNWLVPSELIRGSVTEKRNLSGLR